MSLLFAFKYWNLITHTEFDSALWSSIAYYSKTENFTWKRKLNFSKKTKNHKKYRFFFSCRIVTSTTFFISDFLCVLFPFVSFAFLTLEFYGRFARLYLLNFAQFSSYFPTTIGAAQKFQMWTEKEKSSIFLALNPCICINYSPCVT